MKSRPVEAQLFHADWWTNRHDDDNSCFSKFCERALQCYFRYKHRPKLPKWKLSG